MKKFAAASWVVVFFAASASATTWIGVVSDSHCGPHHTAMPGDDKACIVFIANDDEVYKIENQDAAIAHIGHEVSITGTLTEELTIGVTYETQGNLHVDTIKMLNPAAVSAQEESQFQTWMKSLTPLVNSTRKGITANDKATVSTSATQLAATFEQIVSFWQKQRNGDALKFAVTARDEAKATALASTTFDQRMSMQKLQAACSGCHLAHRAGKAGKFTIEQ